MIDEHGPALLADFQSVYGLDLGEVVSSRSPRHVLALVEGLPDTSRYVAHVLGGDDRWHEFVGWGRDRHMAADMWDLHVAINTPKGKKALTFPRPSDEKKTDGVPLMRLFPRTKPE